MILLWVECVIHLATFLSIFLYNDCESRQRWGISMIATGMAAANIGLFTLILFNLIKPGPFVVHALLVVAFGYLLVMLLKARGNVAKMFPCHIKPRTNP